MSHSETESSRERQWEPEFEPHRTRESNRESQLDPERARGRVGKQASEPERARGSHIEPHTTQQARESQSETERFGTNFFF